MTTPSAKEVETHENVRLSRRRGGAARCIVARGQGLRAGRSTYLGVYAERRWVSVYADKLAPTTLLRFTNAGSMRGGGWIGFKQKVGVVLVVGLYRTFCKPPASEVRREKSP